MTEIASERLWKYFHKRKRVLRHKGFRRCEKCGACQTNRDRLVNQGLAPGFDECFAWRLIDTEKFERLINRIDELVKSGISENDLSKYFYKDIRK